MRLSDLFLPEYDLEMHFTRTHLERVPDEHPDWRPHEKSMPLGRLAGFLAVIPTWAVDVLERDSFDVAPPHPTPQFRPPANGAERLALFDNNVRAGREAIAGANEARMIKPWSLMAGGKVLFTQPRHLVLRTYFLNHAIHHRAQLGVYLRMLGIPVPAIYNDSADEKGGVFLEPAGARR